MFISAIAPKPTTWSSPNWQKSWKLRAKILQNIKLGGYPLLVLSSVVVV
jgi:hypothetical protein